MRGLPFVSQFLELAGPPEELTRRNSQRYGQN